MLVGMRREVAVLALLAACKFAPATTGVDAIGGDDDNGSRLVDGAIDAPGDAALDSAGEDAPPDSGVLQACSTTGLVCPAGAQARVIPASCSIVAGNGACWVGCTNGGTFTRDVAEQACAGWGGHLGWINSATEETCLRATINGAIWLGLTQAPGQASPGAGWTWLGLGTTPVYLPWSGGQPNDGDGAENGLEQCAYATTTGASWQDETCAVAVLPRMTCRR